MQRPPGGPGFGPPGAPVTPEAMEALLEEKVGCCPFKGSPISCMGHVGAAGRRSGGTSPARACLSRLCAAHALGSMLGL